MSPVLMRPVLMRSDAFAACCMRWLQCVGSLSAVDVEPRG